MVLILSGFVSDGAACPQAADFIRQFFCFTILIARILLDNFESG
jgi:hypothetical protein